MKELIVDPVRFSERIETGICVRAKLNNLWGAYDIIHLERESGCARAAARTFGPRTPC